jgi:Fic-DOC domain mobile mystery protein B
VVGAVSDPAHLQPEGDGATPLTPDEVTQLRPSWILDRGSLNAAEARAVAAVHRSLVERPPRLTEILDDLWLRRLHQRMFVDIWQWAGRYRITDRNIGIEPDRIGVAVRNLVDDAALWFQNEEPDVAAARFHHRLVHIHPFPDGNGRHARLAADACLRASDAPAFTWGATLQDVPMSERRQRYYHALRQADRDGDISALRAYART